MSHFVMTGLKRRKAKSHCQSIGLFLILAGAVLQMATAGTVQAQTAQTGYGLLERGWVNDAINAFRQALRNNPQSLEAKLGLATAYQRAGQDAEAWAAYQQVLAQDPNNVTALTAVGQLGSYRPEWQPTGITALTTLLSFQPENTAARAQRALLLGYQGRFAEAITDYEQVLSANPAPAVLLEAAQIYTYSGDEQTGLALFEQYLATGANIPTRAIVAYASALQQNNQANVAIDVLTTRLQSLSAADPAEFELRSALAMAYQSNQQPQEAIAALAPLRNNPDAQLPLARALSTIGRQTQQEALTMEAIQLYQAVLARTPAPSPGLLTEVADVLSEVPDTRPAALQLYQQIMAEQTDNLGLRVKSLRLNYQLGKISRADFWQQIQQLIEPLPATAAEQQQLAQALVQINSPDPDLLNAYRNLYAAVNVPFLQYRIAQMELQQGDTAAARQALNAYRQTPSGANDPAIELLLAEVERQEGDLAASAKRYAALANRYANQPIAKDALRGLAGIRLAQGEDAEALKIYQQLQASYPNDAAIPLGRIAIAYQQQQASEAEAEALLNQWLATTTAEFPPELFLLVGALPPESQRAALYDNLLEVEPNNVAINRRWVQLWAVRDPDKARVRVDQLVAQSPNRVEVYFIQGEFAQAIGDLDLASQAYETILDKQPDQVDALAALAGVRFQQRQYREAETLYQQVLAQKPDDPEIRRVLAELYAAQDRPFTAWQQLQQLQQEQPTTPITDSQVDERLRKLQTQFLRRRGFQPYWERY